MDNVIEQLVSYQRQSEMGLFRNRIDRTHCIVGCGGIGYWVAIFLAMMGARQFVLIDGDKVEATNLARIPVPLRWRDTFKVFSLKATIRLLRPTAKVVVMPIHINYYNVKALQPDQWIVWDCTDDARTQAELAKWSMEWSSMYYKIAYEGWDVAGYDVNAFRGLWIDESYRAGYTTNQSNVLSSVIAAALGIAHVMTQERLREFNTNIGDIICQRVNGQSTTTNVTETATMPTR